MALKIFVSYAYRDKILVDDLRRHLLPLQQQELIEIWQESEIAPGGEWNQAIDKHLNTANIILLMLSPDFLASDYCYSTEMKRVIKRHEENEVRVIPILLRSVHWQASPLSELQVLPQNTQPVTSWANRDQAFSNIAEGIRDLTEEITAHDNLKQNDQNLTRPFDTDKTPEDIITYSSATPGDARLINRPRQLSGNTSSAVETFVQVKQSNLRESPGVQNSVKVFISYAHADQEMHDKLEEHLSLLRYTGKITIWQDQEIPAGANWEDGINSHLNETDVILLLVSPSFIDSKYCWNKEVQIALERHKAGTAMVIPIILKPVAWQQTPLGRLQALPKGAKPISEWNNSDAAFYNVAQDIQKVVENLLSKLQKAQTEHIPSLASQKAQTEQLPHAPLPASSKARLLLIIGIILILIAGASFLGERAYGNYQQTLHSNATATAIATIASGYPFSTTLELNDPLTHNDISSTYAWADHQTFNGSNCFFSDNAYHATQNITHYYHTCAAQKTNFSNFTFEAVMTIIKGNNDDYGGLMFRGTSQSAQFYQLTIDSQGNYDLAISLNSQSSNVELAHGSALPFFAPGLNQHNTISVVAVGNKISIYINRHHIKDVQDKNNTYSSGEIGSIAGSESGPTEVTYTHAKVWQLSDQSAG